jgi:hypothetical protein
MSLCAQGVARSAGAASLEYHAMARGQVQQQAQAAVQGSEAAAVAVAGVKAAVSALQEQVEVRAVSCGTACMLAAPAQPCVRCMRPATLLLACLWRPHRR